MNTRISNIFKISFSHFSMPTMLDKICPELLVILSQVVTLQVSDKEERDCNTDNTTDGSDDESPASTEVVFDRLEDLSTDRGTGFACGVSASHNTFRNLYHVPHRPLPIDHSKFLELQWNNSPC